MGWRTGWQSRSPLLFAEDFPGQADESGQLIGHPLKGIGTEMSVNGPPG